MFDFIASTGRTATTYLAQLLDDIDGTIACHEGYRGANKSLEPILPLINLENRLAYFDPEAASEIVSKKRSRAQIDSICNAHLCKRIIDVAYYNAFISRALLNEDANTNAVFLIRDLESFVRSSTTIEGEDPMPVGWPDNGKALTAREKFIQMGRIRPRSDDAIAKEWKEMSAIQKNIWLWKETNLFLLDVAHEFQDRVTVLSFGALVSAPENFFGAIQKRFDIEINLFDESLKIKGLDKNKKPAGYQIRSPEAWTEAERTDLKNANSIINERLNYVSVS